MHSDERSPRDLLKARNFCQLAVIDTQMEIRTLMKCALVGAQAVGDQRNCQHVRCCGRVQVGISLHNEPRLKSMPHEGGVTA
jgi:hypothetical protein